MGKEPQKVKTCRILPLLGLLTCQKGVQIGPKPWLDRFIVP
jgi:hypothetical protein